MRFSRAIAWGTCALVAIALGGVAIPAFGQAARQKSPSGPLVDSTRLFMQIEQVALTGTTNVFGDPTKPGTYIVRSKLAPNQKIRPHYNDQDRWVTVLKGTYWVGQGDVFRTETLIPVREGGLMYQPANQHQYEHAGPQEVIMQNIGTGPVK